MSDNWPFKEGSDNWPFTATPNFPFSATENFPFGAGESWPFAAAAGPTPPAGYTSWLYVQDQDVGAFPTVANPGSAGGDWTRNQSLITIESGGPNEMQYAELPYDVINYDFLTIAGLTIGDLIAAGNGIIGLIFNWEMLYSDVTSNSPALFGRSSGLYVAQHAALGWIRPVIDVSDANCTGYTDETWRALVMYWDDTNMKARLNGAAYVTGADGNVGNVTTGVTVLGAGVGQQPACRIAEFLTYNTGATEENADALMAYLCSQSGLSDA